MSENNYVDISFSSRSGERTFIDKFDLEIKRGSVIRLNAVDISVSIFIPHPYDFFEEVENDFIEETIEAGESIPLPPLRSDLEQGAQKEYQAYDRTRNRFAWKTKSSPPKIVIR